jgi:N-dimethylarginine dimethylaminohydrolase
MSEVAAQLFGGQTMVARLRRVLVRPPDAASLAHWSQFAWRSAPDPGRLLAEHEQFCDVLTEFGAEVVVGRSQVDTDPDAIYVHDPSLISDQGAIVLRPGKELRRAEVPAAAADLQAAGVPILATMDEPACAEGGDIVWLN